MAGKKEFTYQFIHPPDRCRQTAMFLWWFNPGISIVVIVFLFYLIIPVLLYGAHQTLDDRFQVVTGRKKKDDADKGAGEKDQASAASRAGAADEPDSSSGTVDDSKTGATGMGPVETEPRYAKDETSSHDGDAVIVDAPSSGTQTGDNAPGSIKVPVINTMTPEQIHKISEIFVRQTLLIFVVQPFLIFVGCLFVNNVTFCDGRIHNRSLQELWYMLWVLLPGYLSWGIWLVGSWGRTATVVMGWDEGKKKGDLSALQMVLVCVVLPLPAAIVGLGVGLHDGLIYLVEAGMNRRTKSAGSQGAKSGDHAEKEKKDL